MTTEQTFWAKPPEVEAILAVGSLCLFGWCVWAVIFTVMPAENEKYVMLLLGALIGVVKDTFGRYFQATKGAQDQRKEAAEVARTLADTAAKATPLVVEAPATVEVTGGEPDPAMFGGPRP